MCVALKIRRDNLQLDCEIQYKISFFKRRVPMLKDYKNLYFVVCINAVLFILSARERSKVNE